jgi:putative hydrolase of the HAD superfamily
MQGWCETDEIDLHQFREVMREWFGSSYADTVNPAHALERGELAVPEFEQQLAARLRTRSGRPVEAEGLVERMFAGFRREQPMFDVVRQVRTAGFRTALLSNSWGLDYDRAGWSELFDVVVISGEVQMRKPEPEIYRHTARQLGVEPRQCVFVDDLGVNVKGAVGVGMVGVKHVTVEQTVDELEAVLGIPLRAAVS